MINCQEERDNVVYWKTKRKINDDLQSINCQEWRCAQLLVGKLDYTGLVPFVDELGTVCGDVPLEYGFAVLV